LSTVSGKGNIIVDNLDELNYIGGMNIKQFIKETEAEFIDVKYVDLHGFLRHVTFPVERFDSFAKKGFGIDGSSVPGFASVEYSDMRVIPDTSRFFIDPFSDVPVVVMFGDVYLAGEDKSFPHYPRYVLKKAVSVLREKGIGDELLVLPELEFYIFRNVYYQHDKFISYYEIETHEDFLAPEKSYHGDVPFDPYHEFRLFVATILKEIGISVKYAHHEGGKFSQHEIELDYSPAIEAADNILLSKLVINRSAVEFDLRTTFMPKPIPNEAGSGLHLHMMLVKNGGSVFYTSKKNEIISQTARWFIGGILKHAGALTAFTNPGTNSFKRLFTGFEAPKKITYSEANRSAAIRIPGYQKGKNVDIEYRPPDALMNPYLAVSAIIAAGIDGIVNRIDPGEPVKGNIDAIASIPELPSSLKEALESLNRDRGFLLSDGIFTEELIDRWIEIKNREYWEISTTPSVAEFEKYFGR